MTGFESWNWPAFFKAEDDVRTDYPNVEVLNPARNGDLNSRETLLGIDYHLVCMAHAIIALPGWQWSEGACTEIAIARSIKTPVYRWPDYEEETDMEYGVAKCNKTSPNPYLSPKLESQLT